jgi:Uncharacterized protein conserved in bacteria (DUF2188)
VSNWNVQYNRSAMQKTVRVSRENGSWAVRRQGAKGPIRTFRSKSKAVAAAKSFARSTQPSQIVVEDDHGRIEEYRVYGFPKIQRPPYKSKIDPAQIERAVLKVSDLAEA